MKKILGCLLLILLAWEGYTQSKTYIGVIGGGNVSTVYFNHLAFPTNVRSTNILGAHGGFAVKHFPYNRNNFFNTGLQAQVNFSQKGYAQQFTNGLPNYEVRLNYLTIPLSAVVYTSLKKLKLFFAPGIYGEFIQSANTNYDPVDDNPSADFINVGGANVFPYDKNDDFDKGFGAMFELGLFRDFGFGQIHLSGEVSYSITNLINFDERYSGIPDTTNNIVVGFRLGYFIGIGKLEL